MRVFRGELQEDKTRDAIFMVLWFMKRIPVCEGGVNQACFPGEAVYSVLSRYVRRTGLPAKAVLGELTQKSKVRIHPWLPCYLHSMELYGFGSRNHLLRNHTLFPLFEFFGNQKKDKGLEQAMYGNQPLDVVIKSKLCSSHSVSSKIVKYCPECANMDIQDFGVAIWKLSHQIPGIEVCFIHSTKLIERKLVSSGWDDLQSIPDAVSKTEAAHPKAFKFADFCHQVLILLSETSVPLNPHQAYLERLDQLGCLTKGRNLRRKTIWPLFQRFLEGNWTHQQDVLQLHQNRFFRIFNEAQCSTIHTIYHLFVCFWLFGSVDKLFKKLTNCPPKQGLKLKFPLRLTVNNTTVINSSKPQNPNSHTALRRSLATRSFHRIKLRTYLNEWPSCRRKDVVRDCNRSFHWMYRNDRAWLYHILPPIEPKFAVKRVDWGARDLELSCKLGELNAKQYSFKSWYGVDQATGAHGWFVKHRKDLPMSSKIALQLIRRSELSF